MVVIVILGVLAALVVPRVMSRPDEARAVAAKQDVASIMQALKLYRLDNQRYPSTEQAPHPTQGFGKLKSPFSAIQHPRAQRQTD
jgi:type II secretion system protein G